MAWTPGSKDLNPRTRRVSPEGYKRRNNHYHVKQKLDVVRLVEPPDNGDKWYHRSCRYPHCKREFWTTNPFLRYCNENCRYRHYDNEDMGHAHQGMMWLTRGNG